MDINARLDKLESENRRMKKIGIVAAVVISGLFISGQAKTNKVVEANEFRLVDAAGKVRVTLFAGGLAFYDSNGTIVTALSTAPSKLILGGSTAGQDVSLVAGVGALPASLSLGSGSSSFIVNAGTFFSFSGSGGRVYVSTDEDLGGPSLILTDNEGYSSVFGRANLETIGTGRKTRTPAASLVLFGKDKKVLWSAP